MYSCILYFIWYKCDKFCEWTHLLNAAVYTCREFKRQLNSAPPFNSFCFLWEFEPLSLKGKCSLSSIQSLSVISFMLGRMTSNRSAFIPWRYSTNHHWFYLSRGCRFSKWAYSFQLPVKPIFPIAWQPTSHPFLTLPSLHHPEVWSFSYRQGLGPFFPAFVPVGGEGANSRIDPTFVSWYCSKPSSSIGMGSALTGGGWGCKNEIG